MLGVHLITVGKLKEPYLTHACAEYAKRLTGMVRLHIDELDEHRLPQDPPDALVEQALMAEAERIRKKIPPRAYRIALCVEGKQLTSPDFADLLGDIAQQHPAVALIIGSSHGLHTSLKREASLRLSLSAMTFPHQLSRVLLLEQLYRAGTIQHGMHYHK